MNIKLRIWKSTFNPNPIQIVTPATGSAYISSPLAASSRVSTNHSRSPWERFWGQMDMYCQKSSKWLLCWKGVFPCSSPGVLRWSCFVTQSCNPFASVSRVHANMPGWKLLFHLSHWSHSELPSLFMPVCQALWDGRCDGDGTYRSTGRLHV